ncbi:MAG: YncE family protein [Bacteroidales bacterium]|nr:YncE family protein [Bacteroidales bacterium]
MKFALVRIFAIIAVCVAVTAGCMRWEYGDIEQITAAPEGLFVLNEGNFQYGNATLSYYDPATDEVENEVFVRANGFKLGDVAQSMTMHGGLGWVVVNNSHVIFAIDPDTFVEVGRITDLTSPRCIHFLSDTKAYVTQIWDNRIFIVDPSRYEITGYIEIPGMERGDGSTEMMVQIGDYVYVNCYSYWNLLLKIDSRTDEVTDIIEVGIQPRTMTADCMGRLWILCDGGYAGSPYAYEEPRLLCVDPTTMTVLKQFDYPLGTKATTVVTNGAGDRLYWICDDVWSMPVTADELPSEPLIPAIGTIYYGLTVDPSSGDIYVADAIDYQQQGVVYRFSPDGELRGRFYVGITPRAFCWKTE